VPVLLMTNFSFGRFAYLYGHDDPRLRWPRGGILISIADWTGSASARMRAGYSPLSGPIRLRPGDFQAFEGVALLGQRHVRLDGRLLEVWVQARPTTPATVAAANRALAGVELCG
jgi:hypothetical protein